MALRQRTIFCSTDEAIDYIRPRIIPFMDPNWKSVDDGCFGARLSAIEEIYNFILGQQQILIAHPKLMRVCYNTLVNNINGFEEGSRTSKLASHLNGEMIKWRQEFLELAAENNINLYDDEEPEETDE